MQRSLHRCTKQQMLETPFFFSLTHYHKYHADLSYFGLSQGNAYTGPAKMHCTPVAENLLRKIHSIDNSFIIPREYQTTWKHGRTGGADITFNDAIHCPGAALLFCKVSMKKFHVSFAHSFHQKIKSCTSNLPNTLFHHQFLWFSRVATYFIPLLIFN